MAGGAAGAAHRFRVGVAGIVHMAAQAAAAQQVVGKVKRGFDRLVDRDFRKRSKRGLGAKTGSYPIDLFGCGEMQGRGSLGHLATMACAAGLLHLVWVRWVADEPGMGLFLRCSFRVSAVAIGAGEIVAGVKSDLRMAAHTAGFTSRGFLNNGLFWSLARLLATGKAQDKQAEKGAT